MIAEIYHKFSTDLEDVLTGDFFGAMRLCLLIEA